MLIIWVLDEIDKIGVNEEMTEGVRKKKGWEDKILER
jgi:hypothetical protein